MKNLIELDGPLRPGSECGAFTSIQAATVSDGIPRQTFRKELVRVGQFIKESTGQSISISRELLDHWATTFAQMSDNGVKVPIPSTHAGAGDPDKARGYVKSIFVEGDSLVMTCELVGTDAISAASRNDVSIHSPPEFVDGKGNKYQQPITHVALTPEPLVPGLEEFITIAASLSMEPKMNLKKLAKLLDIEGDVDDSTAESKFSSAIKKLQSSLSAAEKKLKGVKLSHSDPDPDPKQEPKSKPKQAPVLPMVLSLAKKNRNLELDQLVRTGRLDKAARDKCSERYVSDEALTIAMSSEVPDSDGFDSMVEMLSHNQPVQLGENTGQQVETITLADGSKCSSDDVMVKDAERRMEEAKALA